MLRRNHAIIKKKTSKLTTLTMVMDLPGLGGSHFVLMEGEWSVFPHLKKISVFPRPSVWLLKSHQPHCENTVSPRPPSRRGSGSQVARGSPGPSQRRTHGSLLSWGHPVTPAWSLAAARQGALGFTSRPHINVQESVCVRSDVSIRSAVRARA